MYAKFVTVKVDKALAYSAGDFVRTASNARSRMWTEYIEDFRRLGDNLLTERDSLHIERNSNAKPTNVWVWGQGTVRHFDDDKTMGVVVHTLHPVLKCQCGSTLCTKNGLFARVLCLRPFIFVSTCTMLQVATFYGLFPQVSTCQ
jgi:hypothetical protein